MKSGMCNYGSTGGSPTCSIFAPQSVSLPITPLSVKSDNVAWAFVTQTTIGNEGKGRTQSCDDKNITRVVFY